jgi:hypothetical protein
MLYLKKNFFLDFKFLFKAAYYQQKIFGLLVVARLPKVDKPCSSVIIFISFMFLLFENRS